MMQITEIKCPLCEEAVCFLEFWHVFDGVAYHLCSKCAQKGKFEIQELLKIGYEKGHYEMLDKMKVFLEEKK